MVRKIKYHLKSTLVYLRLLLLFAAIAFWRGYPLHRWPRLWRGVRENHEARVRRTIWEARGRGEIYQDEDGFLWKS